MLETNSKNFYLYYTHQDTYQFNVFPKYIYFFLTSLHCKNKWNSVIVSCGTLLELFSNYSKITHGEKKKKRTKETE